jgi:heterodisulfide reductase subunit A
MDNVDFIRYSEDTGPSVTPDLLVNVVNDDDGKQAEIKADLVVLATTPQAQVTNEKIKEMLGVCLEPNHFFMGALGKLRPLDFTADGVFYCGTASAPMGLPEAISQGEGAASRVGNIVSKENLELEPTKSFVVDANCDGCAYCIDPCPFNAITLIEYSYGDTVKKTVQVNEALCKGCGVCMATCPKEGIYVRHFRPEMFLDMIHAALGVDQ